MDERCHALCAYLDAELDTVRHRRGHVLQIEAADYEVLRDNVYGHGLLDPPEPGEYILTYLGFEVRIR